MKMMVNSLMNHGNTHLPWQAVPGEKIKENSVSPWLGV